MFKIQNIPVKVCLDSVSEKVLRVTVLPLHESVKDVFSTIDLAEREWPEPALATTTDGKYCVGAFQIDFQNTELSICYYGKHLQSLIFDNEGRVSFPLGHSHIFGLGHGYKNIWIDAAKIMIFVLMDKFWRLFRIILLHHRHRML